MRAKTDPIDTKMILAFAKSKALCAMETPSETCTKLAALFDRRGHLVEQLAREKNRLQNSEKLIQSIQGVGKITAWTLLAYLTEIEHFNRKRLVALSGKRSIIGGRYVIEAMLRDGHNVGGEQSSGHMIFRDHASTGDGIVSALQILRVMIETGKPLSELRKVLKKYPQAQRNLRVKDKPPLDTLPAIQKLLAAAESDLQGKGRVLLRYSGTEPKIRLLIEGRDQSAIDLHADRIAEALQAEIGEG